MTDTTDLPISHLQRRKIEGRTLIPFIETLSEKLGEDVMRDVLDATIRKMAAQDGARWAETYGGNVEGLKSVVQDVWAGGGGMDVQVIEESELQFDFNVTRCGYAEFFKSLGLAELGAHIHCSRDHAMLESFNDEFGLQRSQTIMQGGACCDFRFRRKGAADL
jgi:predicted ArsR family transcriptional regulator